MGLLEPWLLAEPSASVLWATAAANEEGLSFLRLQGFQATGEPATAPIGEGRASWMRR
jgi:hypothetical protein